MKVAMLAPIAWRTPPRHYGPWEQVTSLITEGLVALGIDVTLFATGDSVTAAETGQRVRRSVRGEPGHGRAGLGGTACRPRSEQVRRIRPRAQQSRLVAAEFLRALRGAHGHHHPRLLQPRRSCRPTGPAAVGLRLDFRLGPGARTWTMRPPSTTGSTSPRCPSLPTGGEDLVILGRIHPDKGTAEAIEIARLAERRLVICGIVQDQRVFRRTGPSHTSTAIAVVYLGSVGPEQRASVLGNAHALLHPIAFEEPFGLSVVESMACGTPVVAYRRGSMPEVVDSGQTGFLVDNPVDGSRRRRRGRRTRSRDMPGGRRARRFSAERMVLDYVAVYEQVLRGGG